MTGKLKEPRNANRPFAECGEVLPTAACVVSLVDRLLHNAEIIQIEGESYHLKEAEERSERQRSNDARRRAEPLPAATPSRRNPFATDT